MNIKEFTALLGLAALWGASFLFIRIASPVFGPLFTIFARVTIAAVALLVYLLVSKKKLYVKEKWKEYLMIGALNAAIPFTLIATAALYLPSSMSAILNSLTPLFTALVVWVWLKEKLSLRKSIGIFIGVIGVGILVGGSSIPFTQETVIAVIFSVFSTIVYGIAGVYAKRSFTGISPLSISTGQQIGASIVLLPFIFTNLPFTTNKVSSIAILSIVGLAIFCTAIAYLIYYYLLENVGPTKTLSVTFLVPVFGMIWGATFLKEEITWGMLIGLGIILYGVMLISDIQLKFLPSKKRAHV